MWPVRYGLFLLKRGHYMAVRNEQTRKEGVYVLGGEGMGGTVHVFMGMTGRIL